MVAKTLAVAMTVFRGLACFFLSMAGTRLNEQQCSHLTKGVINELPILRD